MATVTVFTAERMQAIEDAAVIGGHITGDDLILEKFDGGTVNAGNVRGPTGLPGVSEADFANHLPIGTIVDYIGTTNPSSKWIKMEGQTIVGAQSAYPDWWAKIPASMKSGSNAIMPDTRGKVSVGYKSDDSDFDAIAKTGGSKTHTLTSAEMPSHTHTQNSHNHTQNSHNHTQNAHTHVQDAHTHTQNAHNHTTIAHAHGMSDHVHSFFNTHSYLVMADDAPGGFGLGTTSGGPNDNYAFSLGLAVLTNPNIADTEDASPNTNTTAATNQNATATNQVTAATNVATTATNVATTATNQNTGGGGAHNNVQPYVVFMKIVKVL